MRTPILSVALLLALAACGQSATTNTSVANASATEADEPDITEVPDESADANAAADDLDDANEADDNATGNGAETK